MGRITSILRRGFSGWSVRPVRGKGVTLRFQDRSVAVVARNVVGYGRPDTVASRFARAYHAQWPSVQVEAFGADARRMPLPEAVSPTPAEQPAAMERIDDLSSGTAAFSNGASAEANPTHEGNEMDGIAGAARTEPAGGSAGVGISPPTDDANEDAETETNLLEKDERMTEEDMAYLVEGDSSDFPDDDLEEDEEDAFRLR